MPRNDTQGFLGCSGQILRCGHGECGGQIVKGPDHAACMLCGRSLEDAQALQFSENADSVAQLRRLRTEPDPDGAKPLGRPRKAVGQ